MISNRAGGEPFIKISDRRVGANYPCFIIAELSANHHQDYGEAVALVKAAVGAGVDAVKLQTFTPDSLTIDCDKKWFRVNLSEGPENWSGETLYKLYGQAQTPWEWHGKLKKLAEASGIVLFSTPQDEVAVDFLEKLGVPAYKIASYEIVHVPLLRAVAMTGKPIIASTGFASLNEVAFAFRTLREAGAKEIALLHCITGYTDKPTAEDMNLATIGDLRSRFGVVPGFSYNNGGIDFPVAAAKLGASIIEVHITLDRKAGGLDAKFSSEPAELAEMVQRIRKMETSGDKSLNVEEEKAIGETHYGPISKSEEEIRDAFRRSIFVVDDVAAGEIVSNKNVRIIRPAFGMSPMQWDNVLGRRFKSNFERGIPLVDTYLE